MIELYKYADFVENKIKKDRETEHPMSREELDRITEGVLGIISESWEFSSAFMMMQEFKDDKGLQKFYKEQVEKEMGDILFYVTMLDVSKMLDILSFIDKEINSANSTKKPQLKIIHKNLATPIHKLRDLNFIKNNKSAEEILGLKKSLIADINAILYNILAMYCSTIIERPTTAKEILENLTKANKKKLKEREEYYGRIQDKRK